jgi:23S rRNA (guanosine2251-2'-O)-methyltransferase
VLPKDRSVGLDPAVYKTSGGTVECMDICSEVNLVRAVEKLKTSGFWVYGLEAEPGSGYIHEADLKGNICCVIGGEDTGIRRLLKESCDSVLMIPMSPGAHSFNASVAASLFIYEIQRQRNFNNL